MALTTRFLFLCFFSSLVLAGVWYFIQQPKVLKSLSSKKKIWSDQSRVQNHPTIGFTSQNWGILWFFLAKSRSERRWPRFNEVGHLRLHPMEEEEFVATWLAVRRSHPQRTMKKYMLANVRLEWVNEPTRIPEGKRIHQWERVLRSCLLFSSIFTMHFHGACWV